MQNKVKGKHLKKDGGQLAHTPTVEASIKNILGQLADWKYPVGKLEVQLIVKDVLVSQNIVERRFTNNTPSDDWVKNFCERNKISSRFASNITRARASIDEEQVNNYFDRLQSSFDVLGSVPPSHIFNYDESNVTDDPGKLPVLV